MIDKFTVSFRVTKWHEEKDVFCFGYHPYFQLLNKNIKDMKIETNIHKNLKLN